MKTLMRWLDYWDSGDRDTLWGRIKYGWQR
jgi:hypothetical protein